MKRNLYLILCVLGTILPYAQFIPFLAEHGLNLPLFIDQMFATRIASFFAWDVLVSALALLAFIFFEGSRQGMRRLWVYVVATCTVGVSLGLPLFLYMREGHLEEAVH